MTKQEIYEQVVQLTLELQDTNVAEKIFSTAKEGDSKKVEEVFEAFKKENADLYKRSVDFSEELKTLDEADLGIFGDDIERGFHKFTKKRMDALSLYVLILIAEINEYYLFNNWCSESVCKFISAIEKKGFKELAKFVDEFSWKDLVPEQYATWYELLVEIFKGDY